MTTQEYSATTYLPLGHYPWANLVNPHMERSGRDMERWIDTDYTELTATAREKYKRMRLHACTAHMLQTTGYAKLIPCNRFMLLYVVIDDQLEYADFAEVERMKKRVMKVMREHEPPDSYDNGIDRQTACMRDEYRAFMPAQWVSWFIEEWAYSFTYGIGVETPYKMAHRPPPFETFMALREYSVLMRPYMCWTDIAAEFVLPPHIRRHPVIRRLMSLIVRLVFIQNDLHSYPKEAAKESEVFNIVKVLQHHDNMSVEAACERALRIHEGYLAEFQALHNSLPDFGKYQEQIYHYVECMGTSVQGVNSFYIYETPRYLPGGKGFAWPEIDKTSQ